MSGSNIFMMYSNGKGNVTISPRLGQGNFEPTYTSSTQITVLEGTKSSPDGSMTANIRCDNCLSWSGGSMSTSGTSSWIWASRSGGSVDSTDMSASLPLHDSRASFTIDLSQATGGSSSNPFLYSSTTGVTGASGTSSGKIVTSTGGSSSGGSSDDFGDGDGGGDDGGYSSGSGSSTTSSSTLSSGISGISGIDSARAVHGVMMSALFLLFFPLFALTLYLRTANKVRYIHMPLQILSIILLIIGLATGILLDKNIGAVTAIHQVLGYCVVGCLVFFQPILGIYQHLHYQKAHSRSALGIFHQWLGRLVILAGVVDGGLGFQQTAAMGLTSWVPRWAVVAYNTVAVVIFLIYVAVVASESRRRDASIQSLHKLPSSDYEMHPSHLPIENLK